MKYLSSIAIYKSERPYLVEFCEASISKVSTSMNMKSQRSKVSQKARRARTHQQTRCRQSRGQLRNDNVQSTVQQPDPPLRVRTCLQTSRQLATSTFKTIPQPSSQQCSQSSLRAPSGESPGPSTSDTVQQVRGQHCSHGSTFRALNCPPHTFYNTTNIGTLSVTRTYKL